MIYYLDRHIGLDEDEHTPAALKMIKKLCNEDELKWKQTIECGKSVMQARITFWDGILSRLKKINYMPNHILFFSIQDIYFLYCI